MSLDIVYLICAVSGEYSDSTFWIAGWKPMLHDAIALRDRLTAECAELGAWAVEHHRANPPPPYHVDPKAAEAWRASYREALARRSERMRYRPGYISCYATFGTAMRVNDPPHFFVHASSSDRLLPDGWDDEELIGTEIPDPPVERDPHALPTGLYEVAGIEGSFTAIDLPLESDPARIIRVAVRGAVIADLPRVRACKACGFAILTERCPTHPDAECPVVGVSLKEVVP